MGEKRKQEVDKPLNAIDWHTNWYDTPEREGGRWVLRFRFIISGAGEIDFYLTVAEMKAALASLAHEDEDETIRLKNKVWWAYETTNGEEKGFHFGGSIVEDVPICLYRDDHYSAYLPHWIGEKMIVEIEVRLKEIATSKERQMPDERDTTSPDSPMPQRFAIYIPWGVDGAWKALAGDVPLFLYDNQQGHVIPLNRRDLEELQVISGNVLGTPERVLSVGPVEREGSTGPSVQANGDGEQDSDRIAPPTTRRRTRKKSKEDTNGQPVATTTDEAGAIEANFDPLDMDGLCAEAARLQKVDLDAFLWKHGLAVVEDNREGNGGRIVKVTCPFHQDHSATFLVSVTGIVNFHCFHNRCKGKGWNDVVSLLEPAQGRS